MVRGISIEAYEKHINSGKALTQWVRIYQYLQWSRPVTRLELSERTDIRLSSVCGRVNELIKAELIEEYERRQCSITKEPAHPVGLMQRELISWIT